MSLSLVPQPRAGRAAGHPVPAGPRRSSLLPLKRSTPSPAGASCRGALDVSPWIPIAGLRPYHGKFTTWLACNEFPYPPAIVPVLWAVCPTGRARNALGWASWVHHEALAASCRRAILPPHGRGTPAGRNYGPATVGRAGVDFSLRPAVCGQRRSSPQALGPATEGPPIPMAGGSKSVPRIP